MNTALKQKTTKITLSVPVHILDDFKKLVGQRKVSHSVAQLMAEELARGKREKAFNMAEEIGQQIDKSNAKISTQDLIDSYKEDRKY